MIALLLAQALAIAAPPPLPPSVAALPELRLVRPSQQGPEVSAFVRDEVGAGRCAAAAHGDGGYTLSVDVAVLATPDGQVRRTVPTAIGCPTVEQYAAGLASAMARSNVAPGDDGWYRTTLTFAWHA